MAKLKVRRTHIALFVRDPHQSATWYEEVLGMEEVARGPHWSFMSFGDNHHDIALIRTETDRHPDQTGLQHYGLEIEGTVDDLRRLKGLLINKGVNIVKTSNHGIGYGVYFTDPDGHRLEFFCDLMDDDEAAKKELHRLNAPSDPLDLPPLFD
ncbi:VOC family protein [Bradyrhizobium liaoningense]|uniref:VOC family protein n=1 Tax=Bradyrhizobium liaoningense TaxID=43992 RepID=UPI001BAB2D95|nr:VOC family protein [Bradyrhizobium liaoningense]MBR0843260.1 VOC family protein [Bradyrhizobium liaoningense]MBR0857003.1 VOC family protein [Bradyrhizobium liaoningense]